MALYAGLLLLIGEYFKRVATKLTGDPLETLKGQE